MMSMYAEEVFDKIQYPFMIKHLVNQREGNLLNLKKKTPVFMKITKNKTLLQTSYLMVKY